MLNLILFGPPGSGKGTQAVKISEKYGLLHISTGDLFRNEMQAETELGQQAKSFMSRGQLVPDEITIGMLKNKVESNPDTEGYIFDGFPRTIQQADALDALLSSKGQDIAALIALKVSENEIVKRLLLRGKESGRADDQDEPVIRRRIEVYKEETSPVFQYYESFRKAYQVDGLGSIDEIFERLCKTIDGLPQ